MTVTELIDQLASLRDEHGDREIVIATAFSIEAGVAQVRFLEEHDGGDSRVVIESR